jgi:hypothetical protein|tara:strand:+ start:5431 stop:5586 length:156 start_codon:yes stop_codon:yes gene_type:complete
MTNTVNESVTRVSIEYPGYGTQPYFVINTDNGTKFIPIETGVTRLTDIINK